MKLKCFLIFSVLVSIEGASLNKEVIPVNVVYLEHSRNFVIPREINHVRYLQNRNLDEKVQLSEQELKEANDHVPTAYKSATTDEQNEYILEKTKNAFLGGLSNIRKRLDSLPSVNKPSSEQWLKLNENIEGIFRKYQQNDVKEDNQNTNFFTEMVQSATTWFQQINNNKPNGEEDEPTQGSGIGQIWNDFQQSVSTFFNNVSNNNNQMSTTSTVLGDVDMPSSSGSPDIIAFLNNFWNMNNQGTGNPPQGGTGGDSSSSQNSFQGAYNNFINIFFPSSQTSAPSESGPATPGTIEKFSDAVDQFFGPSTKPPGASGDSESANKPQSSFFDNFGNAIQNIFSPGTTTSSSVQSEGSTSGPNIPIVSTFQEGLQQIGSGLQFSGGEQNGNLSPSANVPGIQQIQNIGQQIAGNVQLPNNPSIEQLQGAGQQLGGNLPSNLNIDQIQTAGQQLGGNFQAPSNLNINQIQVAGQQLTENLQNSAQQLGAENLQVPSNLNIGQIQSAGQQLSGNSPVPSNLGIDQVQSSGQQLLGGESQNGIINSIQSTSNQLDNATGSINNLPNINAVNTQIQQIVGSNQVPQLVGGSSPIDNQMSSSTDKEIKNKIFEEKDINKKIIDI